MTMTRTPSINGLGLGLDPSMAQVNQELNGMMSASVSNHHICEKRSLSGALYILPFLNRFSKKENKSARGEKKNYSGKLSLNYA